MGVDVDVGGCGCLVCFKYWKRHHSLRLKES